MNRRARIRKPTRTFSRAHSLASKALPLLLSARAGTAVDDQQLLVGLKSLSEREASLTAPSLAKRAAREHEKLLWALVRRRDWSPATSLPSFIPRSTSLLQPASTDR